jgi:cytochrome c biogenesis factor
MIGLFLANGYETLDKKDTMPQLVAVLDTNFWLSTHVTAITVGYAAGMVSAAIATFYLLARLFGIRKQDPAFGRNLIRMTYGTLCFGLIFSVVGTILGGIWANESWGRFWGWDPKENGAMLICLTQIIILHGRKGGYLRDFGTAAAVAFQGTVIAFSWFGVNLLGVGLHSYGFTSGIHTALWSYYLFEWGLIAVCCGQYLLQRTREQAAQDALKHAGTLRGGDPAARAAQGPMS